VSTLKKEYSTNRAVETGTSFESCVDFLLRGKPGLTNFDFQNYNSAIATENAARIVSHVTTSPFDGEPIPAERFKDQRVVQGDLYINESYNYHLYGKIDLIDEATCRVFDIKTTTKSDKNYKDNLQPEVYCLLLHMENSQLFEDLTFQFLTNVWDKEGILIEERNFNTEYSFEKAQNKILMTISAIENFVKNNNLTEIWEEKWSMK
jgi:hypothetical protein